MKPGQPILTKQRENTVRSHWGRAIGLGAIGYFLTSAILVADNTKPISAEIKYLFRNPAVTVWATLIAMLVAACAGLLPALIAALREYPLPSRRARWKVRFLGGLALLLFGVFILSHLSVTDDIEMPVAGHSAKVMSITVVIFLFFLAVLYGMCAVAAAVDNLDENRPAADRISDFLKLSSSLQWYVLIAGLIVGGATLTTGTLQTTVSSLNPWTRTTDLIALLSPMTTLAYGLFGSAVVGLYYIPVYTALRSAGMKLRDDILPVNKDTDDLISWYERRTKLETLLGLNKDWFDSLKTGFVLLAPLAGSAISLLMGKAQ